MKRIRFLSGSGLLLLSFAFLVPAAGAQGDVKGPLCPYCKNTGKVPNPFYEAHKDQEEGVLYCSWMIENDPKGLGLPWIPCPRCRNAAAKAKAEAEFAKKAAELRSWLAEQRKIDETLKVKKPLLHLRTKHFLWTWDIPKVSAGRRVYRAHDALHLYARRMERFYADFQRICRISDTDNVNNLHRIFCFERQLVAVRACPLYGGQASPNGKVTKQGKPSVFVTWWNKSKTPSDEDFHRDLIHNVTHLLTSVYKGYWWLYERGFAYEGSAHWWEIHYYGKATSHCFREINSLGGWVSANWESKVRQAVQSGKVPSLPDMAQKPGGTLNAREHIFAWSYIDYMMRTDPHKTMEFFKLLKDKRPVGEAFIKIWGTSILGFEEQWKAFVKSTYKMQPEAPAGRRRRK